MSGLSQRAYAKQRGCDVSLINRWWKAGRLVVAAGGGIDGPASDAALEASMDRTRGGAGGGGAFTKAMRAEAQTKDAPTSNRMTEAKISAAETDAKLKQLEYDERIGNLVQTDRVIATLRDAFTSLSRSVRQIADQMASPMAAETDPRKVHALLSEALDSVFEKESIAFELLAEQLVATRQ